MFQQITSLIQNNRLHEAKNQCEQLIKRNNRKNPDAWLLMADINSRLGDLTQAKKNYQKAIKLKPGHALSHTRLAMLFHAQGMFSKAERSYRQSLKLDKQQATVFYNHGVVLQELNKLDEAESAYRQAINLKPNYVKAHANLGYILRQQGQLDESTQHYHQALQLEPDIPELHYNYALTLLQLGDASNAEKHQRQAIKYNPEYSDAWCGLAATHYFNGDLHQASTDYKQSLQLNPENIDALCGYAASLSELGNHEAALKQIEIALKTEPDNFDVLIQQAIIFGATGEADKSLECCEKVLKESPDNEKAATVAANMYEIQGDAQRAFNLIEPLLNNDTPNISVALCYSAIGAKMDRAEDTVKYLESMLQQKNINTTDRSKVHFALGKAYDKSGEFDKAFHHYDNGNKLIRPDFNITYFHKQIDREIQIFSDDFSKSLSVSSEQSSRPIFIVGIPRSGTSLVEQIIASHSAVFGAGELMEITRLSESLPTILDTDMSYPECLAITDKKTLTQLSQTYLDYLSKLNDDTTYVTDKLPGNFMNLGLIQLLFPNSKIIYCKRNPLDTCLSCYFQNFSRNIPWSYDLVNAGLVYNEHLRLMEHWNKVLDLPILEVQYETLTTNQEEITKNILNFLDLKWEDQCLEFHKNKRLIWTASYNQVRSAMYNKSVERWKNYADHITALIDTVSIDSGIDNDRLINE